VRCGRPGRRYELVVACDACMAWAAHDPRSPTRRPSPDVELLPPPRPPGGPYRPEPDLGARLSPAQRRRLYELSCAPLDLFAQLVEDQVAELEQLAAAALSRFRARQTAERIAAAEREAAEQRWRQRSAELVSGRVGQRRWLRAVARAIRDQAVDGMTERSTLRLAAELLRYADHAHGGAIRPTWDRLTRRLSMARSTLALHLSLLRRAGLLAKTGGGRYATLAETLTLGVYKLAAVYELRLPRELVMPEDLVGVDQPAAGVDASSSRPILPTDLDPTAGSPSLRGEHCGATVPTTREQTGLTAGGRRFALQQPGGRFGTNRSERRQCRYTLDRLPHPRSPKHARYTLAAALVALRPLFLAGQRLSAIAHAVRHVAVAGWTAEDVVQHLDTRPLPASHDDATGCGARCQVRHPARFLAYRLAGAELLDRPTAPAAAQAAERDRTRQLLDTAPPPRGHGAPPDLLKQLDAALQAARQQRTTTAPNSPEPPTPSPLPEANPPSRSPTATAADPERDTDHLRRRAIERARAERAGTTPRTTWRERLASHLAC
jgi:DNA-binding transcriptional ArsR family regulator